MYLVSWTSWSISIMVHRFLQANVPWLPLGLSGYYGNYVTFHLQFKSCQLALLFQIASPLLNLKSSVSQQQELTSTLTKKIATTEILNNAIKSLSSTYLNALLKEISLSHFWKSVRPQNNQIYSYPLLSHQTPSKVCQSDSDMFLFPLSCYHVGASRCHIHQIMVESALVISIVSNLYSVPSQCISLRINPLIVSLFSLYILAWYCSSLVK